MYSQNGCYSWTTMDVRIGWMPGETKSTSWEEMKNAPLFGLYIRFQRS